MSTRRIILKDIEITDLPSANAGLCFDKYIVAQDRDTPTNRSNLIRDVARLANTDTYSAFYTHWQKSLAEIGAQTRTATVKGRMIVGLGNESVLETSVTLHRTYGVPYITGSALKGLAASYARQRLKDWHTNGDAYKVVFGDTDDAGYITFFDALYVPETGHTKRPLYPDVITVHHQKYYQDAGKPPADWDDPNPVPFLSATGSYLIALAAPELKDPEPWLNTVFDILKHALIEMGIGAKTSSGYGRMKLEAPPPPPVDPDIQKAESYKKEVERIPPKDVASQINGYYQKWQQISSENGKKILAIAIIDKIRQAGREKASADKRWYQELVAFLEKAGQ